MRRPALVLLALSTALAGLALMASSAVATNGAAPSAVATGGVAVATGGVAAATNEVAPGQAFTGRVNGSFSHATVLVICPGPAAGPRRRGHPAAGQSMEVLSPPPPVAAGTEVSVGQTGRLGRRIVARFRDAPAAATSADAVTFHQYFVAEPIPTSLWLPCSGTGEVVFRPLPTSPSARSSVVSVTYVNPAV